MDIAVGIDSWIIQDGNYPDLAAGEERAFALEFFIQWASSSTRRSCELVRVAGPIYDFVGQVVQVEADLDLLNLGSVMCYRERSGSERLPASTVGGRLYLGIDPFMWKDHLSHRDDLPNLMYRWRINSISLEMTPWIHVQDESGRTVTMRDSDHAPTFTPVDRTDAWNDDDGHGHYVLDCTLLGAL